LLELRRERRVAEEGRLFGDFAIGCAKLLAEMLLDGLRQAAAAAEHPAGAHQPVEGSVREFDAFRRPLEFGAPETIERLRPDRPRGSAAARVVVAGFEPRQRRDAVRDRAKLALREAGLALPERDRALESQVVHRRTPAIRLDSAVSP